MKVIIKKELKHIMFEPKNIICPKCKINDFNTEDGWKIDRQYKNGELTNYYRTHLNTRIFCDKCNKELAL